MVPTYLIIASKIVLTGFLIYRIQRFLRIHRSWELCSLFVLLTFGAAIILGNLSILKNYEWFPSAVLIFTLLMAFERELSAFLSKIIDTLNPNSINKKNNAISEIARAASALATTKTGALIAFEQNDSLLRFSGSGTEINADIKKDLLTTLFFKDSPTHDGGVLIRGGRVTHCGAVFPLSDRKQIENGLGTRHRAALGLSEKTDAVCLVVSEEEGTISLTKGGELLYAVPPNELGDKLKKLLFRKGGTQYYPLHYLKRYAPKLVGPSLIIFSKSLAEKFYEAVVTMFWFATIFLFGSHQILTQAGLRNFTASFLNAPWLYLPIVLFVLNLIVLLSNQKLVVDAMLKEIKKENRLFFIPLLRKKWTGNNLKAVVVKRESSGKNLVTLALYTKKRKTIALDRSTAAKTLVDYAKKIRDVLRIELIV